MKRKKSHKPTFCVFLLLRNNEKTLRRSLPSILSQCKREDIIAFDTQSEDETQRLLKENKISIVEINKNEFGHGKTRNLSLEYSEADIFIFLNGDAVPLDGWLEGLLSGVDRCDASFSRQIPDIGCDPLRITDLVNHPFFKLSNSVIISKMSGFPIIFDTVSCAIRREVLDRIRFPDVSYGEDLLWAESLVNNDGKILYVPDSIVIHSHSIYKNPKNLMKRHFEDGKLKSHHKDDYGIGYTISFLPSAFFLDMITLTTIDIPLREKILWLIKEPFLRSLQLISFYAGLNNKRVPDIIRKRLLWSK